MKSKLWLAICAILATNLSIAQNVTFENMRKQYQELSSPIVLQSGDWDDFEDRIAAPFPFKIGSQTVDSIEVNDYGIVLIYDNSNKVAVLSAYDEDFISIAVGRDFISSVSYQVSGTAPDRTITFQYKDMGFYDTDYFDATDFVNFQITLHEAGNYVSYNYGSSQWNPANRFAEEIYTSLYFYNLLTDDYQQFSLSGNSNSPSLKEDDEDAFISPIPSNGTLYRFSISDRIANVNTIVNSNLSKVYPLPVQKSIIVESQGNTRYSLLTIDGKEIMKGSMQDKDEIDLAFLSTGVYFLMLETDRGVETHKIVK